MRVNIMIYGIKWPGSASCYQFSPNLEISRRVALKLGLDPIFAPGEAVVHRVTPIPAATA